MHKKGKKHVKFSKGGGGIQKKCLRATHNHVLTTKTKTKKQKTREEKDRNNAYQRKHRNEQVEILEDAEKEAQTLGMENRLLRVENENLKDEIKTLKATLETEKKITQLSETRKKDFKQTRNYFWRTEE